MKYYTEALMNEVKQKKRFSSFFFGDSRRTCYYQATHRENGTYLLWIEGINWGNVITYPCVLIQGPDTLVFENGKLVGWGNEYYARTRLMPAMPKTNAENVRELDLSN